MIEFIWYPKNDGIVETLLAMPFFHALLIVFELACFAKKAAINATWKTLIFNKET